MSPTYADTRNLASEEVVASIIFKGEVGLYTKQKYMTESNIQKFYYLVIG